MLQCKMQIRDALCNAGGATSENKQKTGRPEAESRISAALFGQNNLPGRVKFLRIAIKEGKALAALINSW